MKKNILFAAIIFLLFTKISSAQSYSKPFGLGIMIGEPTAISAKYWLNGYNALDFGLGYSFIGSNSYTTFHIDYLYHAKNIFRTRENIYLHYGFGGKLEFDNESGFGVRGVAGINWMSRVAPVDLFFEIAPVFKLIPRVALDLDAALGGRFYF